MTHKRDACFVRHCEPLQAHFDLKRRRIKSKRLVKSALYEIGGKVFVLCRHRVGIYPLLGDFVKWPSCPAMFRQKLIFSIKIDFTRKSALQMTFILFEYFSTAGIIVLVSEVAKRSDKLGALLISLPLVSFVTLFWLYAEKQPAEKIANHAFYTFWYVLPTLPMFILFPFFLKQFGFLLALTFSDLLTVALFAIFAQILQKIGIILL